MIISSKSAPSTTVTICDASAPTPAKISRYIRATREGVSRRPPRSGSSPIPSRISRTPRAILSSSKRSPSVGSMTEPCYRPALTRPERSTGGGRRSRRGRAHRATRDREARAADLRLALWALLDLREEPLDVLLLEGLAVEKQRRQQ